MNDAEGKLFLGLDSSTQGLKATLIDATLNVVNDVAVNFDIPPGGISRLLGHPVLSLFPRPAAVIFIDIDPRLGASRKSDGTPAEYLADRREHYQDIAKLMGAPIIDGGGTIDEISKKIWELTGRWRDSIPPTGIKPGQTGGDP